MLKLKNLKTLQKVVKLKPICEVNKINYNAISMKIHKNNELSIEQSESIKKAIEKTIKILQDNIK